MPLLTDRSWKSKYRRGDGDLLAQFYVPALECAIRYERTTGYFSAGALTLATRGLEGLLRNGGRMRMVVGCTLEPPEVAAIEQGLALRDAVEAKLASVLPEPGEGVTGEALELLAWMVSQGILEVRVAVPVDENRRPICDSAIFHEKAGILEDKAGNRIAFNGSINETAAGWSQNWESFHAFCDFKGGREHVEDEETSFARLWSDLDPNVAVIDLPLAVSRSLLAHGPADGARPRRLIDRSPLHPPPLPKELPPPLLEDPRRRVWGVVHRAATWPGGGERVGEATSAVEPWPHQVRAFQRMHDGWPCKLLIADEVGLGKTIEAGLLLRQAWLSGRAKRILVLAPAAVVLQWQRELREKFNLNWPIYDGQRLSWYPSRPLVSEGRTDRAVSRAAWHDEPFVIATSHLMRRADRRPEVLTAAAPWDLVVLDEAHHARRKGIGGTKDKGPNQLLQLMQGLRSRTQALLLLTATPMQVDPREVWDLLSLLGLPPAWTEAAFVRFFEKVAEPSPSDADLDEMAALFQASERHFGPVPDQLLARATAGMGRLAARRIVEAVRDQAHTPRRRLSADERRRAVAVMKLGSPVAALVSRHTRELLRSYYQAGKISTRIAERRVEDIAVPLSGAERLVYDDVAEYTRTMYDAASAKERNAVGFIMTVYLRRVASSFAALAETLENRRALLTGGQATTDAWEEDVVEADTGDEDPDDLRDALEAKSLAALETAAIEQLLAATRRLPTDTKARVCVERIRDLRESGYRQVIVFTQYTDTVDFLREELVRAELDVLCFSGRGGEVRNRAGGWDRISRDETKRRFKNGSADVLVCTDAAAEGLNFQFCGALVNYDTPWNPMRVEQRIGRIDRLGQRFAQIRVVNLHYEDTVEADAYKVLRGRIGLFTSVVGKLQPILARLPQRIAELSRRRPADRERDVAELDQEIARELATTERAGFDLDAITGADLEEPVRPAAWVDLDGLDAVLRAPALCPPGWSVRALGAREYAVHRPGSKEAIRVTTSRSFYEDQPESCELWSPGSPTFPAPGEVEVSADGAPEPLIDVVRATSSV